MQRRTLILMAFVFCGFSFVSLTSNAQATDDSINKELNTAEGMAGGDEFQTSDKPVVQGDLVPETPQPEIKPPHPLTPKAAQSSAQPPAEAPVHADENIPEPATLEDVAGSPEKEASPKELSEASHIQAETNQGQACNCRTKPGIPYRDRRSKISGFFGFEGGAFSPENYKPQYATTQTYDSYYGGNASPNIEIVFGAKFNFFLGSLGAQLTGGFFSATSGSGAVLKINPITAGIIYSMDSLFKEPYVVPYFVGGVYTDLYNEVDQGLTTDGQTNYAPFYAVGAMFQLDWIDPETHDSGYKDFGLENTFIFLEMRSFLASNDFNADLSTPLQLSGGLRLEF